MGSSPPASVRFFTYEATPSPKSPERRASLMRRTNCRGVILRAVVELPPATSASSPNAEPSTGGKRTLMRALGESGCTMRTCNRKAEKMSLAASTPETAPDAAALRAPPCRRWATSSAEGATTCAFVNTALPSLEATDMQDLPCTCCSTLGAVAKASKLACTTAFGTAALAATIPSSCPLRRLLKKAFMSARKQEALPLV
mmetsp:Transcript_99021/g.178817  ORF Transcript_99021/g.178817 Transcript_99021/m.178817 type:complete len:200 (-) Transcript_99021:51-650(-)